MNYEVKKDIEITLKLSQEEFNTLVAGFGATNHHERKETAQNIGISILNSVDEDEFYSKIKRVAREI